MKRNVVLVDMDIQGFEIFRFEMKELKQLVLVCVMTFGLGVNAQTTGLYEQTSARPEGTLSQSGATERNLNSQTSNPREYDILFHEAMLQRQKGHHTAAFDLLSRCIEMNPQASEAWFFQAQYLMEMQQKTKALAAYQRAVELNPDNMTMLEELSHAYIATDQFADAINVVEHMYATDKSRQSLLELLYQLYLKEKDYEKAIDVVDRMEVIDGRSERTALAKSGLYIQLGQHDKSLKEIQLLMQLHPNDMNYRVLYANSLMMDSQREQAYEILSDALKEEPDNPRAQQALRSYYLTEEDMEAADSVTHAILLNPKASLDERVFLMRTLMREAEEAGGDSTRVLALFDEMMAQPNPDPDIAEFRAAHMDL